MNTKSGLDYFSFDVDFFQDEKIQFVSARFGSKGEIIVIKLLCKIYRQCYYTDWNNDIALLFAKSVGDGCQHSLVNDVVSELLKRGFFDKDIFKRFSILTSNGIQQRFLQACSRRTGVQINPKFMLIDTSKFKNIYSLDENVDSLLQNVDSLDENVDSLRQSKVKESKVKESKVKESTKKTKAKKESSDAKSAYGDFSNVLLTDQELEKLKERYSDWKVKLDNLDTYIGSTGKKYQSHYLTIINWANKNGGATNAANIRVHDRFANIKPVNHQDSSDSEEFDRFANIKPVNCR